MAISLGSIVVDMTANFANYFTGLDKAGQMTKKATKEIHAAFDEAKDGISNSLSEAIAAFGPMGQALSTLSEKAGEVFSSFGAGGNATAGLVLGLGAVSAAALGAAAGLAEMAISGTEVVERLSHISEKTGISIIDLQTFEAAGKTVGVSLEDMVTSMRKFDQAITGVGKNAGARQMLTELGVTSGNNKEALMQLADAFSHMQDGEEKAAIATTVLGKAGLNMIPFLNKGRDGIKEFEAMVDNYGPTIGEDAVAANEKYQKSLVQIGLIWDSLKVKAEQLFIPAIADTMKAMTDWRLGTDLALTAVTGTNVNYFEDKRSKNGNPAASQQRQESAAKELEQQAQEKINAALERQYEIIKSGGPAALALEEAQSKLQTEISLKKWDEVLALQNQLPLLQEAAQAEADRVARAKQLAASYKSIQDIFSSGSFSRPKFHDSSQDLTQGASPFFKVPTAKEKSYQDLLGAAPDLGTMPAGVGDLGSMIQKQTSAGLDFITAFNDKWKADQQATTETINQDFDKQLAHLQGYFALGEISEQDFNDVSLKLEGERQQELKKLRESTGQTTMVDAWQDMFSKIQNSGKNFAGSLVADIGGGLDALNSQLAKFIATGKGLNIRQIGQSMTENFASSFLKKGESMVSGPLMSFLGLNDGSKPDGSTQQNALWVQFSGGALGLAGAGGDLGSLPLGNGVMPVLSGFGGSGGNMLGGFSNMMGSVGGGIGKLFGSIGSLFGGFFADGGDIMPGRAFMVGERGPELIMPKSASTVIPNYELTSGGKQIAVTNHFHINTPDADSFKKSQSQISSAMGRAASLGVGRNGR